jgi:hypothetical protein
MSSVTRIVTPNPTTAAPISTKSLNYLARPKSFELLTPRFVLVLLLTVSIHAGTP